MGKAMSERPSIWYHRVTSICLSAWWGPETGSRYNIRFDRGEMVTLTREREYNFFFSSYLGVGASFLPLENMI